MLPLHPLFNSTHSSGDNRFSTDMGDASHLVGAGYL